MCVLLLLCSYSFKRKQNKQFKTAAEQQQGSAGAWVRALNMVYSGAWWLASSTGGAPPLARRQRRSDPHDDDDVMAPTASKSMVSSTNSSDNYLYINAPNSGFSIGAHAHTRARVSTAALTCYLSYNDKQLQSVINIQLVQAALYRLQWRLLSDGLSARRKYPS